MQNEPETEPGFASGPWSGFWTQPNTSRFHRMQLELNFRAGQITGSGSDEVGPFTIRGGYQLEDRDCWWNKAYRSHTVYYRGQQQGECISGEWSIPGQPSFWRGKFRVWPGGAGALEEEFFLTEQASVVESEPATAGRRVLSS